ncbi:MAG TPA: low molecular weight protein-tyrosine-phosphatase [Dermatophilaceae bacterium]|nr:low molecular weight protein-tyrosine-phosphatase [Dermatophilaceae bacterium]
MSSRPYRICVVCTGNICRSPMAEWLLRETLDEAGLADRVLVDSAGTSSEERGNPMDRRTVAALRRRGHADGGWSGHRARRFDRQWFGQLDLVLAADVGHERALRRLAPTDEDAAKVRLIRSFDPESAAAGTLDMDDPWWGDDDSFDQTYDEVRAAVPGVVEHVLSHLDEG